MIRIVFLTIAFTSFILSASSQGVAFSYLIPTSGEIAAPISPFSIRGIGFGNKIGLETGGSLYLIPGLSASGLPFNSKESIFGPQYTVLLPLEIFIKQSFGSIQVKLLAGGFFWYNLGAKIKRGNLDRAIRDFENWELLNGEYDFKNKIGNGLMAGIEFEMAINRTTALSLGAQYLSGKTGTPITGSYVGIDKNDNIITRSIDYRQATSTLQGIEISIGISIIN